jgi:hypothetical protein
MAGAVLKVWRLTSALCLAVAVLGAPLASAFAAGDDSKTAINVDCHCPDAVGQNFCSTFKGKVRDSPGYRLAENTSGFGIVVHFACLDLWQGINNKLLGRMSAVSVAFTIYSDKLPGEVLEDSSVFRVGKDAAPDMSAKILAAVGQIVSVNSSLFNSMRTARKSSAPTPTPFVYPPSPSSTP